MATYLTDEFELNKCGSSAKPFLVSWDQTNAVFSCSGTLTNFTISGGTPPYKFQLRYPDGTTSLNTTNFTNLCEGQYTAVTTDSLFSSTTSFITIQDETTGTLTAAISDDSCTTNINQFCKITVSNFDHQNSDHFTYLLYKDNNLYDSYQGSSGEEIHTFSNLRHGNYTLTAYDGNSASHMSQKTELCNCLDGYTLDSSQVFGGVGNTFSGLSTNLIVNEWRRYNLYNDYFVHFATTYGPHNYPPFSSNPLPIQFETGLKSDGSILVDNPYVWLYTGETSTRKTENTVDWYLGTYNLPMEDGDDVGPPGYNAQSDIGVFYYNTTINKFVYRYRAISNNSWFTINATSNRGQNVYPIATVGEFAQFLTGSSAYDSVIVPTTVSNVGYTLTGTSKDVVRWSDVVSTENAVELDLNTSQPILLASTCKYLNYVHEVTLGSPQPDDDTIGVILATFIDSDGLYGLKGTPHHLTFNFNNVPTNNNVSVAYNSFGNSAYAFSAKNRNIINCGYETTMGCVSGDLTGATVTLFSFDITKSPFNATNYNTQGTTFLRIERSGVLGEKFNIKMTDLFDSTDVGTPQSFNSNYEINFNLLDKNTWVGNKLSAPYYAEEKDLYKFLGSQSIGYLQASQARTNFYNISFSGTQSNYNFTSLSYGGSASANFSLGNPAFNGLEMSTSQALNFYNSLGSGGEVGDPTIPRVSPRPTVLMQTTQIPLMETTGGTKISASTDNYVIYKEIETEPGKEEPCVEFNFTWTKNTTDLLNGNMVPYYSLHPYIPEERAFRKGPSMTRIFDNPQGRKTITTNNNQVIGEGLEASDCIKLSRIGEGAEFLIKPNYVFKDKLKNLKTTPCNIIAESLTGMTTGITQTEKWYDTFDPNPDLKIVGNNDSTGTFSFETDGKTNTREYGLYDSTTDFYFLKTPEKPEISLETNDILYGINNSCGKLTSQQIEVSPVSGTSGTTLFPIVVSGQPYTVTLDFPASGPLQVTLNGLTLFASGESDLSDGGDYYFDGNSQIKFRPDTIQGYDLINIIYVPGTFERSYYYDSYVVPSTVPNVSGGTNVSGNTLYTNGFYYFFETTHTPIGDIGITLNGTVLSPNSDYKLIANNIIQFTGIEYPSGLIQNDIIGQFYFTKFNLLGASGTKNPKINVMISPSIYYVYEILLIVRNEVGTIVYTETKKCEPNEYENITTLTNAENQNETIRGVQKTFKVVVPEPGKYTYSFVTTTIYTIINGDTISDSYTSETYSFSISAAVFYDESDDDTINITPSSTY